MSDLKVKCLDCQVDLPGVGGLVYGPEDARAVLVWLCPACLARYPHQEAVSARLRVAGRTRLGLEEP